MQTRVVVDDGATTVIVAGEIDLATSRELSDAINKALTTAPESLVIDLSEVSFCDSSGLGVLAVSERECKLQGVQYRITGVTGAVRRVFDITGLDELLDDDEDTEASA